MKKLVALAVAAVMATSLLAGCAPKPTTPPQDSGSTDTKGEQVTISYMETQPTEAKTALLKKMLDKFMVDNPTIKVDFISTPNDQAAEKLFNLAAAGQLPDIIELNDSWLAPLASSGNLEDLTAYMDTWEEKDNIVDSALQLGRVMDDKLYYLPYGLWGTAVYYNTEMLEKTGLQPPVNTEDFYAVAKAMTDAQSAVYGYSMRGGMYGPTHALMWMLGEAGTPNVIDPATGKSTLDSPAAIEGLSKYNELYKYSSPDSVSWAFRECVDGFTSGVAGMLIQSNEVVQICNEKMGEGKFGTTMLPVGASGKTYDTSGQTGYAMSAKSANKDAAWKLFSFLLDPEESREYTVSMGFTPINKKLADDPAFAEGPGKVYMEQVMSDAIQFANNPSYLPQWGDFVGPYGSDQVQRMLLGEQTPEATAKNMATFLNEAEAEYRAK